MSSISGLRAIGLSALRAAQTALSTTGHNITNLNTEGYSRQRVELQTASPQVLTRFNLGTGVEVRTISRIVDGVVNEQLLVQTSNSGEASEYLNLAQRLDGVLGSDSTSLAPALEGFFNAIQAVSDDPSSALQRQALLSEAGTLTRRFQLLHGRFAEVDEVVNVQVREAVAEVNRLSSSVAELNRQVTSSRGLSNQPNDLLDQRDQVVREIAEKLQVTTIEQDDGSLNVFSSGGQALVLGTLVSELEVATNVYDPTRLEIANEAGVNITDSLTGGTLGASLQFRRDLLDPAINGLGRVGMGLAETFNAQHRLGMDFNGNLAGDFFVTPPMQVTPATTNTGGTVAGQIADVSALTTSDYLLTFNGGNSYTLLRESDGQSTAINTGGASPFTTTTIDGFTLTLTAGAAAGDTFKVRPVANGAALLDVAVSVPFQIAAAAPVSSQTPLANLGTGDISDVQVNGVTNLPLTGAPVSGPLTMTFNSATNQLTLVPDPNGESPLSYNPATEAGGKTFTVLGGEVSFTLSGIPRNGDSFSLVHNSGGVSDNRNALALANLQSALTIDSATVTLQEAFGQLVTNVGSETQVAEISEQAFAGLLDQAKADREQISGVNLDEEAANLVRFQQAYQAAAQLLGVVDSLFQTILTSLRV